jgi:hypothetical protein
LLGGFVRDRLPEAEPLDISHDEYVDPGPIFHLRTS